MKEMVSFCITSYNRPRLLKECVKSFFKTNLYDPNYIELIIVDNGSTSERALDYIKDLEPPCAEYNYILNEKNDFPVCLKYAKVQARRKARGDFYIDCPDDHLFVVETDWISDAIRHMEEAGNVGCIIYYAYPAYRFLKDNNAMQPYKINNDIYRSLYKGYADYHIMSKSVYEEVGEIDYKLEIGLDSDSCGEAEKEYMKRTLEYGYYRNMFRYPVAVINDGVCPRPNKEKTEAYELVSAFKKEEVVKLFNSLSKWYPDTNVWTPFYPPFNRPVTNEEMVTASIRQGKIRKIENYKKVY